MRLEGGVGGRCAVRFGDHAEIALMLQHPPVALSHDWMIVDQQDRDAWLRRDGHGGNGNYAAIGMVAATLRPRRARAIDSDPPSAATRSRIPVSPKPADCVTLAASPPPSSSTQMSRVFSLPVRRSIRSEISRAVP